MCVKFSLNLSKMELENCFNTKISFDFFPIKEGVPFQNYPILGDNGIREMTWGNPDSKIIHKRISDIKHFKKGILPITGFYTFKKEKIIAPIGFGDHKETLKLHPLHINQSNKKASLIAVLYDKDQFYILIEKASEKIIEFQPNEPLVITSKFNDWIELGSSLSLQKISDNGISINNI